MNPKLKDAVFRPVTALHTQILRWSKGRLFSKVGPTTMGILTTTGRKSGQPRATPLNIMADGDRWLLVASFGGDDRDPQWFKNLQANPEATIQLGSEIIPVRATVATADEKPDLWRKAVSYYKGYEGYQRRTSRDIPVVILSRRAS